MELVLIVSAVVIGLIGVLFLLKRGSSGNNASDEPFIPDIAKRHKIPPFPQLSVAERNVGHANQIAKQGLTEFVNKLHEVHGPVACFFLGDPSKMSSLVVSCNDPDYFKPTLKMGSRPASIYQFIEPLLGKDNLQVYDAERGKIMRRFLAPAFGHQVLVTKFPDMVDVCRETVITPFEKYADNGQVVNIQQELFRFGLKASVKACISLSLDGFDWEEFKEAYDDVMSGLFDRQYRQDYQMDSKIEAGLKYLKESHAYFTAQRQQLAHKPNDTLADLLDLLVYEMNPVTGQPFDEATRESLLVIHVIGAYHTSVISVTWTIFLLTQHPDIMKKCQAEIDSVLGGRFPEFQDLEKFVYTTQALKEAMRVYAPGPFSARLAEEDITIGGYSMPKDSIFFYPIAATHKNPKYWPEPEKYDPDRFSPANLKKTGADRAFIPFGAGLRICPGDRFAWVEIRLVLAALLQKFDFELATPASEVKPIAKFVQKAENDVKVRVYRRKK